MPAGVSGANFARILFFQPEHDIVSPHHRGDDVLINIAFLRKQLMGRSERFPYGTDARINAT